MFNNDVTPVLQLGGLKQSRFSFQILSRSNFQMYYQYFYCESQKYTGIRSIMLSGEGYLMTEQSVPYLLKRP